MTDCKIKMGNQVFRGHKVVLGKKFEIKIIKKNRKFCEKKNSYVKSLSGISMVLILDCNSQVLYENNFVNMLLLSI